MSRLSKFLLLILTILITILLYYSGQALLAYLTGTIGLFIGSTLLPFVGSVLRDWLAIWFRKKISPEQSNPPTPTISQTGTINIASSQIESLTIGKLPTASPLLASLTNEAIPRLPEYYIDRTKLISEAISSAEDKPFFLALVGMGGTGKSILANSIAREEKLNALKADGVIWNRIGLIAEPEQYLFSLLGDWLPRFGEDPKDYASIEIRLAAIQSALSGKSLLIVFDDVWDSDVVKPILSILGKNCSAIVTTRSRDLPAKLGIRRSLEIGSLSPKEARKLVAARIGATIPETTWLMQIKPVMQKLAWHPLGVSLSAAQVASKAKSWSDLIEALNKGESSAVDFVDADTRDESLEATFNLSVSTFDEAEQRRFAFLGALAKGFPFTLTEAANTFPDIPSSGTHDPEKIEVRQLSKDDILEIRSMLDKFYRGGLLELLSNENSFPFYAMHPLIHDFCNKLLFKRGEQDIAFLIHSFRFSNLAKDELSQEIISPTFVYAEPQFRTVLVRAYDWLTKGKQDAAEKKGFYYSIFVELISHLSRLWSAKGQVYEAVYWQEKALRLARSEENQSDELELLLLTCESLIFIGRTSEAIKELGVAEDLAKKVGAENSLARIKNILGLAYLAEGKDTKSIEILTDGLDLAEKIGDEYLRGIILGNIGQAYMQGGNLDKAAAILEDAVTKARSAGSLASFGKRYGNLAQVYQRRGEQEIKKASVMLMRSLDSAIMHGDVVSIAKQLIRLSEANFVLGHPQAAKIYAEDAISTLQTINHPHLEEAKQQLARVTGKLPDPAEPLSLPELFMYVHYACLGNRVMALKAITFIDSVLEFEKENASVPDLANSVRALKRVMEGERDLEKVVAGTDATTAHNLALLVFSLSHHEYYPFAVALIHHLQRAIRMEANNEVAEVSGLQSMVDWLSEVGELPFDNRGLAPAISSFISGERNFNKLADLVSDASLKHIFLMFKEGGEFSPVIYGEGFSRGSSQNKPSD